MKEKKIAFQAKVFMNKARLKYLLTFSHICQLPEVIATCEQVKNALKICLETLSTIFVHDLAKYIYIKKTLHIRHF